MVRDQMGPGPAILEGRGLILRKGRKTIIGVEAIHVHAGEVLAIVGPNGAGKSTLLQVLAGLIRPTSGEIRFDGERVGPGGNLLAIRRRMAIAFQHALLLDLSVFDNVAIGLRMRGRPEAEVKERVGLWLATFGIESLARQRAKTLSGGEAQRVSLARALVLEPEVLFLDEPFSALDYPTRASLLREFGQVIRGTKVATIFVTHDFTEIPPLADRVAIMSGGKILEEGNPADLHLTSAVFLSHTIKTH